MFQDLVWLWISLQFVPRREAPDFIYNKGQFLNQHRTVSQVYA